MNLDFETLKTIIFQILKEHFDKAQVAVTEDLTPYFTHIAELTAKYALSDSQGEIQAEGIMADLRAQSGLLAAIVYERGYKETTDMFKEIVATAAKTLGIILKAAIL